MSNVRGCVAFASCRRQYHSREKKEGPEGSLFPSDAWLQTSAVRRENCGFTSAGISWTVFCDEKISSIGMLRTKS